MCCDNSIFEEAVIKNNWFEEMVHIQKLILSELFM